MNHSNLIIIILLLFGTNLGAQNITRVNGYQEGKNIIITYHLDKATNIKVQVSTDGGKTYSKQLKKVIGDVGDDVTPGDNRIIWNALSEFEDFGGSQIKFKVTAVPVKVKFQNSVSVHSGWVGNTAGGMSFSLIPTSIEYLAGVRLNKFYLGVGADACLNSMTFGMADKSAQMKSNGFTADIIASIRYYTLKNNYRLNPYLEAKLIYGLDKQTSYNQTTNNYIITGNINSGGIMWSACVGLSFRLTKSCAGLFSLGMRSYNIEYNYSVEEISSSLMTHKVSNAMLFVPTASIGITF